MHDCMTFYSYLRASIGSRLAAFLAGYQPKNTPITVHTTNDKTSELGNTTIGHDIAAPIIFDAAIPSRIPITPPVILSKIDSVRNCNKISNPFPPIAIRSPISLVRSVTDTYIMFMIPIPPTRREIPAIAPSKIVRILLTELKVDNNSAWFLIVKSFWSDAFILCVLRKVSSIWVAALEVDLASTAEV